MAELIKGSLTDGRPDPLHVFLQQQREWTCHLGVALNKFAVVPSKTEKTPQLSAGLGWQQSFYGTHFVRVGLQFAVGNLKTQKFNLGEAHVNFICTSL